MRALLGLLLLLGATAPAQAFDAEGAFSVRGFYTLDASVSQGADVFLPTVSGDRLLLKDGEPTADASLLGAQGDIAFSNRLSAAAQGIVSRQTNENWAPTLEWAYLKYDLGDDWAIRGGKFKLPFMQGTELRYVGYSRLWARPLAPSNGAAGFDDYVGLDIAKQALWGDYFLRFEGSYGVAEHQRATVHNDDIKLLSARLEKGDSWISLALFHARYDVKTNDGRYTVGENAQVVAVAVETEFLYDIAVFNLGCANTDDEINPDEQFGYLSAGYRGEGWTPYLLYQYRLMRFSAPTARPADGAPTRGGPPPGNNVRDGEKLTHSYSLGLRFEAGKSAAIKLQAERGSVSDRSQRDRGDHTFDYTTFTLAVEGVF